MKIKTMMIRKATKEDLSRIAEIYVFNNRINYWPIFKEDDFSFGELQVVPLANEYFGKTENLNQLSVFDDGLIKGFVQVEGNEIRKLYVEPFFQSQGIGAKLIEFAIKQYDAEVLWALEKNEKAISFYKRHGFIPTEERMFEEGTTEYLVKLVR